MLLMWIAAGEAYGYEVWDGSDLRERSGVFVVEEYQKVEIDNLEISDEVCLVIKEDGKVVIKQGLLIRPGSKVYIFGELDISGCQMSINYGTVYVTSVGTMEGTFTHNLGSINQLTGLETKDLMLSKFRKVEGQVPSKENGYVGWKDYYAKGMETDGDFIPFRTFEDEECKKEINFEKWKKPDGRSKVFQQSTGDRRCGQR